MIKFIITTNKIYDYVHKAKFTGQFGRFRSHVFFGYAIWGFAKEDFFEGHTLNNFMKETPDMLFIALGNLIGAFSLSSIYGKWAKGVHSAKEGFQFGI